MQPRLRHPNANRDSAPLSGGRPDELLFTINTRTHTEVRPRTLNTFARGFQQVRCCTDAWALITFSTPSKRVRSLPVREAAGPPLRALPCSVRIPRAQMLNAKLCLPSLHPTCALEEFVRLPKMDSFSPCAGPASASCASHFFKDLFLRNINWLDERRQRDVEHKGFPAVDLQVEGLAHTNDPPFASSFSRLIVDSMLRSGGEAQRLVPNQAAYRRTTPSRLRVWV